MAIIALDKLNGEENWREEAEGLSSTWSTPVLVQNGDVTEGFVTTPAEFWAIDADTGKLKWYAAGLNARGMATSPVVGDGALFIRSSKYLYCVSQQ